MGFRPRAVDCRPVDLENRVACGVAAPHQMLEQARQHGQPPADDRGCSSSRRSKYRLHVAEYDHQCHGIERRRLEAEGQIEGFGFFRDGVNDDASNADAVGSVGDSSGAVTKQGATQSTTLPGAIYRETAEQSNRDRVGHIAPEPAERTSAAEPGRPLYFPCIYQREQSRLEADGGGPARLALEPRGA